VNIHHPQKRWTGEGKLFGGKQHQIQKKDTEEEEEEISTEAEKREPSPDPVAPPITLNPLYPFM
jgi:hypothetical protein